MNSTPKHNQISWRELLTAAVSPFESGVQSLKITGYRPPGVSAYRPAKTAAVLVPLLDCDEPELVLTRRAAHLVQHAGQISFPGGAAEEQDESAVQTALREAQEEIGLPPEKAVPIGFLDRMDTISDYRVLPVVALVKGPVVWKLDRTEVAEVFTIPLSFALDRDNYARMHVSHDGKDRVTWSLRWGEQTVWGATCAILLNLLSRVENVHGY